MAEEGGGGGRGRGQEGVGGFLADQLRTWGWAGGSSRALTCELSAEPWVHGGDRRGRLRARGSRCSRLGG